MTEKEKRSMQAEELIRELPKGLIKWYSFKENSTALCVVKDKEEQSSIAEAARESGIITDSIALEELDNKDFYVERIQYDYIIMIDALEYAQTPVVVLKNLKSLLNKDGKMFLGMDNRLGIRYFCGDRDPFTDRNFDGVENYKRINPSDRKNLKGHLYAKSEIETVLEEAGFLEHRFYSVLPELKCPQILFAEDYQVKEELSIRIFPQYNYPDTVFLEEENLYTTLIQNGLFHTMANGFLIECPVGDVVKETSYANANQITISMDRGRENAMCTIIRRDGNVEKRPIYPEGCDKLQKLMDNHAYLQAHNVRMIPAHLEKDTFVMPYVHGIPVTLYFRNLLRHDRKAFLEQLDAFWQLILNSSEHVPYENINWEQFEPWWEKRKADDPNKDKWKKIAFGSDEQQECLGVILKRGYIDLVSLNGFFVDDSFLFYDQEIYMDNLPAKVILLRTIDFIYYGDMQLERILPRSKVFERYKLDKYQGLFYSFIGLFSSHLLNTQELASYHNLCRRTDGIINSNRQRMNYSTEEYEHLFRDIFKGTEGRELYLFGSGNFSKKFLSQFGAEYPVKGILDNNQDKWGTQLLGNPILSPECLRGLPVGSYKVIICIKNYVPVMKQLKKLGVRDYSIFDSNLSYPRKKMMVSSIANAGKQSNEEKKPKKYHTGYIAGVFDLFHVGHLNMFKRAKEQCDYLIVGVVNDESVMNGKKTMPFVPFEERIEMVRSCRYVDEAVEIPTEYGDTDEAYRRYQFDVQFSGSDYANDPIWLAKKAFLQKQGSDMVFFPYTQSTSSTNIKELIRKKLL